MSLFLQKKFQLMLAIAAVVAVAGCSMKTTDRFAGRTMGTTYHIQVVAPRFKPTAYLGEKIEARLVKINQSMSTYLPLSEISRFNAMTETGKRFCVSPDFVRVMAVSSELFRLTHGAWDGTVSPLDWICGGSAGRRGKQPHRRTRRSKRPGPGWALIASPWTTRGVLSKRHRG